VTLSGTGEALGLATTWRLSQTAADLSYAEEVHITGTSLPPLLSSCTDDCCWQTDLNGLERRLEREDAAFDRALLVTAVRSGVYAEASLCGTLHASHAGPCFLSLSLLPDSSTRALLQLDESTHLPLRLTLHLHSGGEEVWAWAPWPTHALHTLPSGQTSAFLSEKTTVTPPLCARPPVSAAETPFSAAAVPLARCAGGQLLVQARIRGVPSDASWMVLDPCCDTAALTAAAADAAQMPAVGRQRVAALDGSLEGPLRQGALSLGDLCLPETSVFQQLSLDGAVAGAPQGATLAGVLGQAALLRCVLHLRLPRREPGARSPPAISCTVLPRDAFVPSQRQAASWQRVTWLDGAPHVTASLRIGAMAPFEGLFRLALGVGGTAVLLSSRAAACLNFCESAQPLKPTGLVVGAGESRGRIAALEPEMLSGRIDSVDLRGGSFATQRCVVHSSDPADLELIHQAAGLLCADLFRGCEVVLDLGASRIAVLTTHNAEQQ